jgi:hypothetical protein
MTLNQHLHGAEEAFGWELEEEREGVVAFLSANDYRTLS